LIKNYFLYIILDRFNVLIFKIKKYYFNTFPSKKLFELQPLPHFQTSPESSKSCDVIDYNYRTLYELTRVNSEKIKIYI